MCDVRKLRDVGSAQELVAAVARRSQLTNARLVEGWRRLGIRAELLCPPDAYRLLGAGDIAVVRLDVTPTLDGVEAGLAEMAALERRGVRVVNRPGAVLTAHDKLRAAQQFAATGIRRPRGERSGRFLRRGRVARRAEHRGHVRGARARPAAVGRRLIGY